MVSYVSQSNERLYPWTSGSTGYDVQVDYLIEGILPANSFGVVYGPSGSFKSFLVMDWAAHIATGKTWSGRNVKKAAVLYVVAEGGIGAPRRIKAWERANLKGGAAKNFYSIYEPVHIADPRSLNALMSTIKQIEEVENTQIELVVFDTLARCFNGADENSTRDMNFFVSGCDMLKAMMKVSVLIVHHSGKNEANAARGSSALRAACDFEFKVVKNPSDDSEGESLTLSCEKMKDDQPIKPAAYTLKPVMVFTNHEGKNIYSLSVDSDEAREVPDVDSHPEKSEMSPVQVALWEIIRSRSASGESTVREIIRDDFKALGYPVKNFSRSLQRLQNRGVVIEQHGQLHCMVDKA
ncbi:helicase RepA family protein [Vibrio sp. ZSDZ34]|uniref:Helicase RepA family protein n=1 Tax=Vibrio gelatinilyticus TaxID=2893468 RepID=A0A9X1W7Y8_9VIBR|nr:helicase RepA family protein [Vibrio gelatinilyticus]MCJ2375663.1 helicase RepA family protein [Vibrio gelatinilyticus]